MLLALRTTTGRSAGLTPYRLVMGQEAVLPIELEIPTWKTLPWERVRSRKELIALRTRQIERRDKDMEDAVLHVRRTREANKDYFNDRNSVRAQPLAVDQIVLLHDTRREDDMTSFQKLRFRWVGPYRISEVLGNGAYRLMELDDTPMSGTANGNRLKQFLSPGEEEATNGRAGSSADSLAGFDNNDRLPADEDEDLLTLADRIKKLIKPRILQRNSQEKRSNSYLGHLPDLQEEKKLLRHEDGFRWIGISPLWLATAVMTKFSRKRDICMTAGSQEVGMLKILRILESS